MVENYFKEVSSDFLNRINVDIFTKLLLIDSIDFTTEDERVHIIEAIDTYSKDAKCRFIIADRVADGLKFDQRDIEVRDIKISNFNVRQVEEFVSRYFEQTDRGKKFVTILRESNLLNKIPTTPLILSLLSILYDERGYEMPATQTDIFRDFTQVLLGKLEVRNQQQLLALNLKTRLISVVALEMLDQNRHSIQLEEFVQRLNKFLSQKGYEPQLAEQVRLLVENTGFLYIDQQLNVGFKNASFLEFFASGEIYDHRRNEFYDKLVKKFNDPHWQNTAVFFAGRSKDMPDFISDLLQGMPNDAARDLGINIGGLGYLGQALYLTDLPDRKKLVHQALDNSVRLLQYMKEWTADKKSPYYNLPVHILVLSLAYWFSFNFRSVTISSALRAAYDELLECSDSTEKENFDLRFKIILVGFNPKS